MLVSISALMSSVYLLDDESHFEQCLMSRAFWAYQLYIYCLCEWNWRAHTKVGGLIKTIFGWLKWTGLKWTSQSGIRSFYKPCSEKFVLHIWVLTMIQLSEINTPGDDTKYDWWVLISRVIFFHALMLVVGIS